MDSMLPLKKELSVLHSVPVSMAYDGSEDFSVWQKKAKEKLSELLGIDKFEKCFFDIVEEYRVEHDDFTEIKFYFQSEKDYYVPCILCIPQKTDYEKPPLMICLQGHGTGMHVSLGIKKYDIDRDKDDNGDRDFALQCIEKGFCALALEQRNFGEKGGTPRPDCYSSSLVALLTGRTIIGARVWDIMRAIDVLIEKYNEFFDTEKIYCTGNSGGGTATFYASALESRIKAAMPSCAFCTFENSIGELHHCACNYVPGIRNYFDMAEIAGMSAPKPMVIVSGKTDGIFPIEFADSEFDRVKNIYYSAAGKEENCTHVVGSEGHRFYAEQGWKSFFSIVE